MSERGIEIHNGEVVFPEGMPQTLHLGTEASPLTQGEAAQIVVSAVINAVALGGNVTAGYFAVIATVSLACTNLIGAHSGVKVAAGITVTGIIMGHRIMVDLLGVDSEIIGNTFEGLRIELGAPATASLDANVYGIFITNYIQVQPDRTYAFIRASENGGVNVNSLMHFTIGGVGDCLEWMRLTPSATTGWATSTDKTGTPAGWLLLNMGATATRYIQLYQ